MRAPRAPQLDHEHGRRTQTTQRPTAAIGVLVASASFGGEKAKTVAHAAAGPAPAWPGWRKVIKEPDAIYDISNNAITDIRYEYPGGHIPKGFSASDDGYHGIGATMVGRSGDALLRGVGWSKTLNRTLLTRPTVLTPTPKPASRRSYLRSSL